MPPNMWRRCKRWFVVSCRCLLPAWNILQGFAVIQTILSNDFPSKTALEQLIRYTMRQWITKRSMDHKGWLCERKNTNNVRENSTLPCGDAQKSQVQVFSHSYDIFSVWLLTVTYMYETWLAKLQHHTWLSIIRPPAFFTLAGRLVA